MLALFAAMSSVSEHKSARSAHIHPIWYPFLNIREPFKTIQSIPVEAAHSGSFQQYISKSTTPIYASKYRRRRYKLNRMDVPCGQFSASKPPFKTQRTLWKEVWDQAERLKQDLDDTERRMRILKERIQNNQTSSRRSAEDNAASTRVPLVDVEDPTHFEIESPPNVFPLTNDDTNENLDFTTEEEQIIDKVLKLYCQQRNSR